jgi:hypothetical protein
MQTLMKIKMTSGVIVGDPQGTTARKHTKYYKVSLKLPLFSPGYGDQAT